MVKQQDNVDNQIRWILDCLFADLRPAVPAPEWTIGEIGAIRDSVQYVFKAHGITEYEFYPYLTKKDE